MVLLGIAWWVHVHCTLPDSPGRNSRGAGKGDFYNALGQQVHNCLWRCCFGQDKALPWDHHPPSALPGTVPNEISSVSVILQEIKQAFQTQENQGIRKRPWWKPGDASSINFCSTTLISLVWKMTSFTFTNLSLFCMFRIVSKCHLILTSDSESNTVTDRKFSGEELPYVNWKIKNIFWQLIATFVSSI